MASVAPSVHRLIEKGHDREGSIETSGPITGTVELGLLRLVAEHDGRSTSEDGEQKMKKMTRRGFLERSAAAGLGTGEGAEQANSLLTRRYRPPCIVPDVV